MTKLMLTRFFGLALVAAGVIVGCYKPDIKNGDLTCGGPAGDQCPEGFRCLGGKCFTSGSVGGSGGTIGTGGQGGSSAMCLGPLPGCTPQSNGTCDPVCQTGCADCSLRCNLTGTQTTCQAPSGGNHKLGDVCTYMPVDSCDPGLICLPEIQPVCGAHCYRYCRKDGDCPERSHCSVPLSVGDMALPQFVCDVPSVNCLPFKGAGTCARGDGFGCYVAGSKYPDEVVCDCAGVLEEGMDCTIERAECKPGLVCVSANANEKAKCRGVCPLNNTAAANVICGPTATCVPYGTMPKSTKYGYCR